MSLEKVTLFTRWVLKHRAAVLIIFAAFWAFNLFYIFKIEVNNQVERLVKPSDPRLQQYAKFLEWFGSDELALISVERPDGIYDKEFLKGIERLEESLSQIPSTAAPTSLLTKYRRAAKLGPLESADMARLKALWLADPLNLKTGLTNKDGTALSVIVPILQDKTNARKTVVPAILKTVERAKKEPAFSNAKFHLVGQPFVNFTMDNSASEVGYRFFPVFFVFTILTSIFIYSSVMATIAALLSVGTAAAAAVAMMAFLNIPMSLLTTALPVTLFIILLAGEIHFRNVFFNPHDKPETTNERLERVMALKFTATVISVATVMVGFGSLSFSDVPSIGEFGLFIAYGMLVGIVCHFTLFPVLISLFFPKPPEPKEFRGNKMPVAERVVHRVFDWTINRRWTVFAVCTAAILAGGSTIFFMKYETNPINYLDEKHPAKEEIKWFEKNMSGAATIELAFDGSSEGAFSDPKAVLWLVEAQKTIENVPGVRAVVGVPELLKEAKGMMWGTFAFPEKTEDVLFYANILKNTYAQEYNAYLTPDGRRARFTIICDTVDYIGFNKIIDGVRKVYDELVAAKPAPQGAKLIFTGQTEMLTGITAYLAATLTESLFITVIGVGALVFITFWSMSVTMISLLQNLFGIALMFAFMFLTGIKLNTATILIASVLLGIEIDNTIHFLYHTRQGRELGLPFREAGHFNLTITGRAIASTNFIIAVGFAIFYLSDFPPIRHFGVLIAIGMIFAIAGVLVYLPALISILNPNVGLAKAKIAAAQERRNNTEEIKDGMASK